MSASSTSSAAPNKNWFDKQVEKLQGWLVTTLMTNWKYALIIVAVFFLICGGLIGYGVAWRHYTAAGRPQVQIADSCTAATNGGEFVFAGSGFKPGANYTALLHFEGKFLQKIGGRVDRHGVINPVRVFNCTPRTPTGVYDIKVSDNRARVYSNLARLTVGKP